MNQEIALGHKLRNLAHTGLLIGGMAAILAFSSELLLGDGVWPWVFAGVVVAMWLLPEHSSQWLLNAYHAEPIEPWQAPGLTTLTRELAQRAGLERMPTLYWIPSRSLNAFTVGNRKQAAVAITDGLLRRLSPRELAGVLAHEISHITHNDTQLMALADLVSRLTHLLALLGGLLVFITLPLTLMGWLGLSPLALLLLVLAPSLSALLQLGLSRVREFDADLAAAQLTGDPQGLAAALSKLEATPDNWWQRLFYSRQRESDPSLLRTHPQTQERIERLLALGEQPQWSYPRQRYPIDADFNPLHPWSVRHSRPRILYRIWR